MELSDLLKGQNLSVSVYATPINGEKRIDKFASSIKVSNKIIDIIEPKAKAEIFDRHHKNNEKYLAEINKYLGKDKLITMNQFKDWVVNDKLPDGITKEMVTKQPRFIEGRAMIQGNLCVNKTEAIGYPLLKKQPKPIIPPPVDAPKQTEALAYIGASTALTEDLTNIKKIDIGTSTLAHIPTGKTPKPDTPSYTTPEIGKRISLDNSQIFGEVGR